MTFSLNQRQTNTIFWVFYFISHIFFHQKFSANIEFAEDPNLVYIGRGENKVNPPLSSSMEVCMYAGLHVCMSDNKHVLVVEPRQTCK